MTDHKAQLEISYAYLQKKYSLPALAELDEEFDIIDKALEMNALSTHPLRNIRRQLVNWCFSWVNYLHGYAAPNPNSAIGMEEFNMFSEEDKANVLKTIERLMMHSRAALQVELSHEEKEEAAFIKAIWSDIPIIKAQIMPIVAKNVLGWKAAVEKQKEKKGK